MKKLLSIISVLLVSGCASVYKPVPEGYTGPTANVADSFRALSGAKVEFFYVEKVDGHDVRNSRSASLSSNVGRGMYMAPVAFERALPASRPMSLVIVARTEFAAPILGLTNPVYQIKGTLDFTPEANKRYVVKGLLGDKRSSVWIEDAQTQELVGKKFEVEGSTALGFFEK